MERLRREGIAQLEEVLSLIEEIVSLARISVSQNEKEIHREVREAFLMKTKTELLVSSISAMYNTILDIDTLQHSNELWKTASVPSPVQIQRRKNREQIVKYLEKISTKRNVT